MLNPEWVLPSAVWIANLRLSFFVFVGVFLFYTMLHHVTPYTGLVTCHHGNKVGVCLDCHRERLPVVWKVMALAVGIVVQVGMKTNVLLWASHHTLTAASTQPNMCLLHPVTAASRGRWPSGQHVPQALPTVGSAQTL